jgi:hypothetical protein
MQEFMPQQLAFVKKLLAIAQGKQKDLHPRFSLLESKRYDLQTHVEKLTLVVEDRKKSSQDEGDKFFVNKKHLEVLENDAAKREVEYCKMPFALI